MAMYGADVAQLRALASHFEHAAEQLETQRTRLGAAVQASPWTGPSAKRFRGEWHSEHGVRLASAAGILREGGATLRRNAEQQEQASAAVGGSLSAPSAVVGAGASPMSIAELGNRAFDGAEGLLHAVRDEKLFGVASAWDAVMALKKGVKLIGVDLPFAEKADHAMELFSLADRVRHGNMNVFDTADTVSNVLNMVPGKVAALGSLAIDSTSYAAQQAMKADFSGAEVSLTGSYIVDHPLDALAGAGDGIVKMGHDFALPEIEKFKDIPFLGAAVDATSYAVQQGAKADFSSGTRAAVADYVVQHPVETLQTIGESVLTVGKEALSWHWFK